MRAIPFKKLFSVRRLTYAQVLEQGYTVMLSKRYAAILARRPYMQPAWAKQVERSCYKIYRFGWRNVMLQHMDNYFNHHKEV